MAQPRTKLPIPEPTGSEFFNFDRLMGILLTKQKPKPAAKPNRKTGHAARRKRLPRP
jgi:hypothetical protein